MKKSLKSRIRKWKVGDYIRQFSIVVGGVLLTLWLTSKITDSAKQREVGQAMQLVALELRGNLQIVESYESIYNTEKRIALHMQELKFQTASLSADSILFYRQRLFNGLSKPYSFSTNALEMLKTSGLAMHIDDKQQIIDLLHCYTSLEVFIGNIELYFNLRKEAITAYTDSNLQATMPTCNEEFAALFEQMIADPKIQDWLNNLPRGFDNLFFKHTADEIEEMAAKLENAYK